MFFLEDTYIAVRVKTRHLRHLRVFGHLQNISNLHLSPLEGNRLFVQLGNVVTDCIRFVLSKKSLNCLHRKVHPIFAVSLLTLEYHGQKVKN